MTKVKVKENGQASETKVAETKEINLAKCYSLSRAIYELSSSVPSMKGKIVYALTKNEYKLESILKSGDKDQQDIICKYAKLNKDGTPKITEPSDEEIAKGAQQEYIYAKDSDRDSAEKEMKELMDKTISVDFHKIWMNDFENIDIVPARNTRIGLFIEYLVVEKRDLQMIQ